MKRMRLLDTAPIPGGDNELGLYQHDGDFLIKVVGGQDLMSTRIHGSEDTLAEIACREVADRKQVRVLIGGLGMGFTLAGTFDETHRLEELKRELTVDMRQLRDPAALIRHARELGFRRAERLIELDGNGPVHRPSAVEEPAGAIELVSASPRRPLGENP